jgi:peptidoglycan/xylan/chitin deacetylase (PgdA/CDA1 family)
MGLKSRLFRYYLPDIIAAGAIRRIPSSSGIVLMYHEVLPDDVIIPAWTIVRESDFCWQMHYLQKHFDVVTMDEAVERVAGRREAKRPFAVVTFDDGYKGNVDIVLPLMESSGLPFILYAATQAIVEGCLYWYDEIINLLNSQEDVSVNLTWDGQEEHFKIPRHLKENRRWKEVQRLLTRLKAMPPEERERNVRCIAGEYGGIDSVLEMLNPANLKRLAGSNCVTVGSHTHQHELLDQLAPGDVRETLYTSNEHITRITGSRPKHFSYPNGNFNQLVLCEVQDAGYETAVTTLAGIWSSLNYRLNIPRVGIGRFETREQFKARLSGFI